MKRWCLVFGLLAVSCAPSGDSVVVIHVQPGEPLPPLAALLYEVENGTTTDMKELSPDAGVVDLPTTFALLIPQERSGNLQIRVAGLGTDNVPVVFGSTSIGLRRSKRVDAVVVLRTGTSSPDGGTQPADAGETPDAAPGPDVYPSGDTRDAGGTDQTVLPDSATGPTIDTGGSDHPSLIARNLGEPCASASDCASGACADGLCCDRMCDGACTSCNLPGMRGRCTPVPVGPEPRGRCPKDETPCGRDGQCNGLGQCRRPSPGSTCSQPRCANGSLTPAGACDQVGTCITAGAMVCSNGCSADGTACNQPPPRLADGESCTMASQCLSNTCSDGVCCATACGPCHACNLTGSRGRCRPVPDGQDPAGHCAEDMAQPCGLDGSCNGAGGCRLRQSGVACMTASCSGASKTSARVCDGMGNCLPGATSSCLPGTCNAGGTDCDATCANNPAGCPAGQICSSVCGIPSICCRP